MNISHITIGTRGSQLSLAQTNIVKNLILKILPTTTIDITIIKTKGDKNMAPIPLDTVGKGWFTKELDQQLLEGDIDLAVHSLKDIPETLPRGLIIATIPQREDAREALVSQNNLMLSQLPKGACIGTDSTRRKSQILHVRPDIIIKSLRGNVNRRLEKLEKGEYDAICLAVAGLKRLGLTSKVSEYFDENEMIPSPGQGALAVVIKEDNTTLLQILKKINNLSAEITVSAERAFSNAVGGGCKMPIGAYATINNSTIVIHAFIGSTDGKYLEKDSIKGKVSDSLILANKLAQRLLRKCASWYSTKNKLHQKYIVITRPLEESKVFEQKIEKLGLIALRYPTISIQQQILSEQMKKKLFDLEQYDWIIFTSANGFCFFMQALTELNINQKILQAKKIAAVGPKTAEAIKKFHLPVTFIPSQFTTEFLANELPDVLHKKILLPRATIATPLMEKLLEKRKAQVTNIPMYQTKYVLRKNRLLKEALQNDTVAAITFTSPSTVDGFMKSFRSEKIKQTIFSLPIISIGPVTTKRLNNYGFRTIYTADIYTTEGMIEKLVENIL